MSAVRAAFQRLIERVWRIAPKRPSPLEERAYQEKLTQCAQRLVQSEQELRDVRVKLHERAERVTRLAQRYDDQARKHFKLNHKDLAHAAIRQRVKDQIQVRQWEEQFDELARHLKLLLQQQTQLEAERLSSDRALNEFSEHQATIERIEERIRRVHAQLATPWEQYDEEVSALI